MAEQQISDGRKITCTGLSWKQNDDGTFTQLAWRPGWKHGDPLGEGKTTSEAIEALERAEAGQRLG